MADKVVSLEAADVLGLASNFIPQGTTITTEQEHADMIKANGDIQKKSTPFNQMDSFTAPYRWNADTGLGTALQSLLGSVQNGYLITEIAVATTFNDWPTITFTAHNHAENPHSAGLAIYDIPADIRAILTGAFGAYDFAGKAAGDVCVQSGDYTIRLNHIDAECATGNHWVGSNVRGEEELSVQYLGNIATPTTLAGWTVNSADTTDGTEAHDTSSITAVRAVLRN
jgi:hypothetical protein